MVYYQESNFNLILVLVGLQSSKESRIIEFIFTKKWKWVDLYQTPGSSHNSHLWASVPNMKLTSITLVKSAKSVPNKSDRKEYGGHMLFIDTQSLSL